LLKAALAGGSLPYSIKELHELARHCTEQEDEANKIERLVRKSAAALLLESRIGQRFDAIVTGASDKGTWVRILEPPVEGKVVRGHESFDVGDQVRVKLVEVEVEHGFIDFVGMGRKRWQGEGRSRRPRAQRQDAHPRRGARRQGS
jgi:exoribonuclease-2